MSNVPYKKYLSFNYFIITYKTFLLYFVQQFYHKSLNTINIINIIYWTIFIYIIKQQYKKYYH